MTDDNSPSQQMRRSLTDRAPTGSASGRGWAEPRGHLPGGDPGGHYPTEI